MVTNNPITPVSVPTLWGQFTSDVAALANGLASKTDVIDKAAKLTVVAMEIFLFRRGIATTVITSAHLVLDQMKTFSNIVKLTSIVNAAETALKPETWKLAFTKTKESISSLKNIKSILLLGAQSGDFAEALGTFGIAPTSCLSESTVVKVANLFAFTIPPLKGIIILAVTLASAISVAATSMTLWSDRAKLLKADAKYQRWEEVIKAMRQERPAATSDADHDRNQTDYENESNAAAAKQNKWGNRVKLMRKSILGLAADVTKVAALGLVLGLTFTPVGMGTVVCGAITFKAVFLTIGLVSGVTALYKSMHDANSANAAAA